MARQRSSNPWTCAARGAVTAAVVALLSATVGASTAAATPPTRTVHDLQPFVDPAGTACCFDVAGEPARGLRASTTFADGRVMDSVRAHGAYVNLATGRESRRPTTSPRSANSTQRRASSSASTTARPASSFGPGDLGPFGTVAAPGALDHFVGTIHYTDDTNRDVFSVLSDSGTVTDVCAALS